MKVGDWIKRMESGTRWHLVESIVAGDAIIRCGKRMAPVIQGEIGLEVSETKPTDGICGAGCDR